MKRFAMRIWKEEQGFLTFEWTLLVSLLTVGAVSGVAAIRDATVDELGDVAQSMLSLDQSYGIDYPLHIAVHRRSRSGASDSWFRDRIIGFQHCDRTGWDCQPPHADWNAPGVDPRGVGPGF